MSKKFNIPNPKQEIEKISLVSKYTLGEKGYSFYEIKKLTPVFAFDYLSLEGSDLCFNSNRFRVEDFIGLLDGLKKVSKIPYETLKTIPNYRFHSIDFDDSRVNISKKDFRNKLTFKEDLLPDEALPTLYQFDLQYVQEARVCGFLFKGIFYLVWYDRFHSIYKSK
jgi:hypothetical protein